jgi:sugar phosphate isomerase/epimerase
MSGKYEEAIRIGTLVNAKRPVEETLAYIEKILPLGFESFQLTWWQTVDTDLRKLARKVADLLSKTDTVISSLAIFGNPLETGQLDKETLAGWKKLIEAAHLFGCDIVAGFSGRLRGKPIPDSLERYKKIFAPLSEKAAGKGVRLAFENCSMGGTWNTGDWNIAHSPQAWELMFDVLPAKNVGLCWEPCHQLVCLIDPLPQLRKYADRIFHVHGKDATVLWDVIREKGIGGGEQFAYHRTPGFGDSNWTDIISILRMGKFKGSIDIEGWHDPVYRKELEMTGQAHALNYLKNCRGTYVPPVE